MSRFFGLCFRNIKRLSSSNGKPGFPRLRNRVSRTLRFPMSNQCSGPKSQRKCCDLGERNVFGTRLRNLGKLNFPLDQLNSARLRKPVPKYITFSDVKTMFLPKSQKNIDSILANVTFLERVFAISKG